MRHLLLAMLALNAGCTLVLEDKVNGFTVDARPDLVLQLRGMEAHELQRTEIKLVNDMGFVQGHAVLDPLPAPDFDVVLRNSIEPDIRRIDFWADYDENGRLSPPTPDPIDPTRLLFNDHMWRNDMVPANGQVEFIHNTNFTNIVEDMPATFVSGPLTVTITGADAVNDQEAEVFVWLTSQDRQVGYYYLGAIVGGVINAGLEGIIDGEVTYQVEVAIGGGESSCTEVTGVGTAGAQLTTTLDELGPCD